MEVGSKETDFVYALCGVMHVDDFKTTIFIACRENEGVVVDIFCMSGSDIGGLNKGNAIISAGVLIDVGLDFVVGVDDFIGVVADGE